LRQAYDYWQDQPGSAMRPGALLSASAGLSRLWSAGACTGDLFLAAL